MQMFTVPCWKLTKLPIFNMIMLSYISIYIFFYTWLSYAVANVTKVTYLLRCLYSAVLVQAHMGAIRI